MLPLRLLLIALTAVALYGAEPLHVVIMHTNDIHGHVLPGPGTGGSAALSTVVRRERPDLLLDAGDSIFGTMISNMFEGETTIAMMNAIGYDAAVLGNHEFNFGLDGVRRRARQAQFPFLAANVEIDADNIGDAAIFNAQGTRLAVIGLTTHEVMRTGHPRNMRDIEVIDVIRGAEKAVARVRDVVDFIVFLTHVSNEEEIQLARAFPEVRLIISGHDHTALEQPLRVGNTTIVRTGSYGKYAGRVDLYFEEKKLVDLKTRLIPLEGVDPDPEIQELLKPYETQLSKELDSVVGHAAGDMSRSPTHESHVGDLVADALRKATGTQITLNNAGSVRIGIPKGPITERIIFDMVPFDNSVITMKLTGAQIKRILSRAGMNVSGLRVKLDVSKPVGERLVSVTLDNGRPLRDKDFYTVTTNDFLLAGGDGHFEFKQGVDVKDTGLLLRDAVTEHIRAVGTLIPRLDGRIKLIN